MWELYYKESWVLKNWCFWTVVLDKTLKNPLDCKKIQPVHSKGNQSWIFIGRTDAEAEASIVWPPDAQNWLIWKDPNAGKDWRQEEKRRTDRGWNSWMASLTQWTWVWVNSGSWWWTVRPGVLQSMGSQKSDMTERLNWTEQCYFWNPRWLSGKEFICQYRRHGFIPWLERSPGGGNGNQLEYSCLGNPMDGGSW